MGSSAQRNWKQPQRHHLSTTLTPSGFYNHHFLDIFDLPVHCAAEKENLIQKRRALWLQLTKSFLLSTFSSKFNLKISFDKGSSTPPNILHAYTPVTSGHLLNLVPWSEDDYIDNTLDDISPFDSLSNGDPFRDRSEMRVVMQPPITRYLESLPSEPPSNRVKAWIKSSHRAVANHRSRFGHAHPLMTKCMSINENLDPFSWTLTCSGKYMEDVVALKAKVAGRNDNLHSKSDFVPFKFILHVTFVPPPSQPRGDFFGLKLDFVQKEETSGVRQLVKVLPDVHDTCVREAFQAWRTNPLQ